MLVKCRIKCRAQRGAFDQEFVVRIPIVDSLGRDVEASSLAYSGEVTVRGELMQEGGADAELEAYRLAEQCGLVSVVLPQPTFQNGPSVIVRKEHLVA